MYIVNTKGKKKNSARSFKLEFLVDENYLAIFVSVFGSNKSITINEFRRQVVFKSSNKKKNSSYSNQKFADLTFFVEWKRYWLIVHKKM